MVTRKGFDDASRLIEDPEALRARAEEKGYLFFRGLLSRDRVTGLRYQLLRILDSHGLLEPGADLLEARANVDVVNRLIVEGTAGIGVSSDIYLEIQQNEEFHAIAHDPALLAIFRLLFQDEVFVHPRNICRLLLPHAKLTPTPPHQDFLHIQGTPVTWTCWFPIGDCPLELGGLAMLEGSHHLGLLGVTESPGAGGLETILCNYDLEWVVDDFQAGDAIIFHSHTVHKAMPNQLGNKARLSCDFRYQPLSQAIDPSSLKVHGGYEWDEVYRNWKRADLKYYWQNMNLAFSEWDESIRWQKEKIC